MCCSAVSKLKGHPALPLFAALLRLLRTLDGAMYTEAPVNRWAQMIKARDAADVELFEAVLDKMNARQARRDALAAAAEQGDDGLMALEGTSSAAAAALAAASEEPEGEDEEEQMLDELYGPGYTEFMTGQDGMVFYDDADEDDDEAGEGDQQDEQQ